jgi:hypothetical protein
MPVEGFVLNTEITTYINEGVQILHEKLVRAHEADYTEKSASFTLDSSGEASLPTDFMKVYGVELSDTSGGKRTLLPYKRAERNALSSAPFSSTRAPRYKLSAGKLRVLPAASVSGKTGTIWYAPVATLYTSDTSSNVDFLNGWERYVVVYAAIQCLLKEESDTRPLENMLAMMDKQLDEAISNRDAGHSNHAVDVENINDWEFWTL